jgi:chitooligosaccharide deacetylase
MTPTPRVSSIASDHGASIISRLSPRRSRTAPIFNREGKGVRAIALTFDDGPAEWTPPILDILAVHRARATFFLLGAAVIGHEAVVRRIVAEGHELGNHTYSHHDPETLADDDLHTELARAAASIAQAAEVAPALVRPPYCADAKRVARVATAGGFGRTILRSVDPADWNEPNGIAIASSVVAEAVPGAIVCLHDGIAPGNRGLKTRSQTVEAVALLVPALLEQGYQLVTVSELLA